MTKAASEDTEITLGTGKMLALFFGLVALCAVFFAMGFSLGRTSGLKPSAAELAPPPVTTAGNVRPSAVKPTSPAADMTFYKAVSDKNADSQQSADHLLTCCGEKVFAESGPELLPVGHAPMVALLERYMQLLETGAVLESSHRAETSGDTCCSVLLSYHRERRRTRQQSRPN